MACCVQSAKEFILNAFPAFVGALASDDAELICIKNNLSFVELIRPFCQLDGGVNIHDPVNPNVVISVKNFKIRVIDIQASIPPKVLINRVLNEVVNRSIPGVDLNSKQSIEQLVNSSTHWYEAYRDCFFQLIPPMRHEFLRDYLACILIVSTKHPDPMHAFAALSARQNALQHSTDHRRNFNWFNNNTFKYYLLLHDVSEGEDKKAEAVFQSMKSVYGSHTCFLLRINSRKKVYPNAADEKMSFSDPWSSFIYPFSDETLDVDENEEEKSVAPPEITNQKDADKKEEIIVNELENIEKQIEENHVVPPSLTFNDPLTSMHYNRVLEDDEDDFSMTNNKHNTESARPRKISERTLKLQEYKKSLSQFSYNMVTQTNSQMNRKERGQCMTLIDQDKIKAFVYEFAVRGLLPHIEKTMRNISEQIIARKGIHKSLFHATKKWFGGNKPAASGNGIGMGAGSSYHSDSPELQHRKLGDLSFIVQHYELAYSSYHTAKREFNNEHAWMYFAGALEMSAISSFMQGTSLMYPVHYFEACISTYLNTCRMPDYATRACLMSTEALKTRKMYPEAAMEFIRLTNEVLGHCALDQLNNNPSDTYYHYSQPTDVLCYVNRLGVFCHHYETYDCDLRSALLLEQAAHCYLYNRPSMIRKYAFHMILAGHRYLKSSQRKHTLRCYINALQVYQSKGWNLAQDHVNSVIGRQTFNLGNLKDSLTSLKFLLSYESQQPPVQQASYLREYLAVFKQNLDSLENKKQSNTLPELPIPNLLHNRTRCLLHYKDELPPGMSQSTTNRSRTVYAGSYTFQKNFSKNYLNRWAELEKEIVLHVTGDLPYPFKPYTPCLSSFTENKASSPISQEEQFAYEVHFSNPLKIPLNLLRLMLLWELTPDDNPDVVVTNKEQENGEYMYTEKIENFQLKPVENKAVSLRLKPYKSGALKIIGVKYVLSSVGVTCSVDDYGKVEFNAYQEAALYNVGVPGMQLFRTTGPRLNSTKQERSIIQYGVDKRLQPLILHSLPLLEVTMEDLPLTLLCGEIKSSNFTFKNVGKLSLHNLYLISNKLEYFSFGREIDNIYSENGGFYQVHTRNHKKNNIVKIPLPSNELQPGNEISMIVNILGLDHSGVHEIDFLFYYEPIQTIQKVPYRLLQQMVRIQTLTTLHVTSFSHVKESIMTSEKNIEGLRDNSLKDSVLTVCIENKSQASASLRCAEISLKELHSLSAKWKVTSLVKLPSEADKLRPGETCLLHLKVTPIPQDTGGMVSFSPIQLTDDDNMQKGNTNTSLDLFMKSSRNTQEVLDGSGLLLVWETFYIDEGFTRNTIRGQTHILPTNNFNEVTNCLPTSQHVEIGKDIVSRDNNGVTLTFDYPATMETNFQTSKLCRVPVTVLCSNATSVDIEVFIEAENEVEQTSDATTKPSNCYLQWTGQLHRSLHVPASSCASVVLDAVVTDIGIYSLKNIHAHFVRDNEKVFLSISPSLFLSVRNAQM